MKNTFGQSVAVTLFGESHGNAIGVVIDGLCPGLEVDKEFISRQLSRRRPSSPIDTPRWERDPFVIMSGVFNGETTGTPICIVIPNENVQSKDYNYGIARPSHADYAASCKYYGFEDYRGGGHFSGRVTAALVAAGGIIIPALARLGIGVGTHILKCGTICDREFEDFERDVEALQNSSFPTLDGAKGEAMAEYIMQARAELDSVGGVTQTAVYGLKPGIGEPWFDSVESEIAHIVFSLGGIKGIEFGRGFAAAEMRGSEFNDAFRIEDRRIVTKTNNNGGINGGITNGMPVVFQCAVKPTPSIGKKQETVDFVKNEETQIEIHGRHDPAIIRRICPVIDSVTAIALCDMISQRFGTDIFIR